MQKAGIKNVIYSNEDGKLIKTTVDRLLEEDEYFTPGARTYGGIQSLKRFVLKRV